MRGLRGSMAMLAVLGILLGASPAAAQTQPPARKSDNVTWKTSLAEPQVISARFSSDNSTMYVSTLRGLAVYDVTNAEAPAQVGFLPLPHFENEDVDLSVGKDFVLISNDPSEGVGVLYVIDVSDPAAPALRGQMQTGTADLGLDFLPPGFSYGTGHTASCVPGPLDDCQYAYLAGTRLGIDIVDLTDPDNPVYATPRNLPVPEASGGLATHDVQFDRAGRALIVGAGGTTVWDVTAPLAPVLLAKTDASGASDYAQDFGQDGSTLNDLIHHNSHRLPNSSLTTPDGPAAADSNVMVVTEEDYSRPTCAGAGSLQTWRINEQPGTDTITNLDSWEVEVDPARTALCSAHYFDEDAGLLAQGWYEQGTRFLDVTNPAAIRQVGFWIPEKNVTWGAVYHPTDKETVYALDNVRGIDVLHVERGGPTPPDVTPPPDDSGNPPPDLCELRPPTDGSGCPAPARPAQGGSNPPALGAKKGPKLKVRVRGGRRARAGRRAYFRVAVRNIGDTAATGVKVRVRLPKRLKHLKGGRRRKGSRTVVFSFGRLDAGKVESKRMTTRVRRGSGNRTLTLRARGIMGGAAATAAMRTVRAPVTDGRPRQRFVAAYGLCRIVIRD